MPAQPFDEVGAPDDDPGLGPAEQLVAGEADEVGAGGKALLGRGLVLEMNKHTGAEVVDEREVVPARDGCELGHGRLLREADHAEVRLVHAQQHGRLRADRTLVVGGARPVRRADLAQARARACEHVRYPEAVADLDQLAAGDEYLAALRERGQGEHHGRRVVVDDECSLGARQPAQDCRDVVLPRPARSGREVVLEVRVAAPDLKRAFERSLGQRRAAQVRVDDHAGRVERTPQARRPRRRELS